MIRAISIVLIVAIALQSFGCSTWRPVVRVAKSADDDRQSSVRDHVLGKLNEGMAVRIRILEGTHLPIIGQVIECVIEKVGATSLTVTPMSFHAPGNIVRTLTLDYSDIASIEYRESNRERGAFVGGVAAGAMVIFVLILYGFSQL